MMKLDVKSARPWRRVSKPVPKYTTQTTARVVSKSLVPPVSPKPGSKVYLYVYDIEPRSPSSAPQYVRNPHFTKQDSLVPYPYEKEKENESQQQYSQLPPHAPQQRSGRQRVREQGRKGEKGYKVLADVTANLRSSSRGGKMFVRQRNRMENFTKEGKKQEGERNEIDGNRQDLISQGTTDAWPTPWNLATKSPTAVKYITAKRLAGPVSRPQRGLKEALGFLPKPPDFWRAKVEQNFPTNGQNLQQPIRSRSVQRQNSGPVPLPEMNFRRSESAPPVDYPIFHNAGNGDNMYNPEEIYDGNLGHDMEYEVPLRPASVLLPSATIHFNAKRYYATPHRRQGLRRGWGTYTTTPCIHKDFNARPAGWHRNY